MTTDSWYSPKARRRASEISPTVAYASTAARMAGIRFSPAAGAAFDFGGARRAAFAASRRARNAFSRATCVRSISGSMRRVGMGCPSSAWNDSRRRQLARRFRPLADIRMRPSEFHVGRIPLRSRGAFRRSRRSCRYISRAPASISSVSFSMAYEPAKGSIVFATPVSCAMICCVRRASSAAFRWEERAPHPGRWCAAIGSRRAPPPGLECDADDIVFRLLRGQRRAGRLRVKTQHHRARIFCAEAVAHDARPQAPRRAELRDLHREIRCAR